MSYRVVGLSQAQALQLARYERDSLLLRAKDSQGCPDLWRRAARQADRVVRLLRSGDDKGAVQAALAVGPAWKKAADCEGWRTPLGLSEAQEDKLDRILRLQKEEARKRKIAFTFTALGALFAAGRLGVLAVPLVKARRARR